MDKERIFEIARNAGTEVKGKTRYVVNAAGGSFGVFLSVDGFVKGDKIQVASGVFIAATTSTELALSFIHRKTNKGRTPDDSDSRN